MLAVSGGLDSVVLCHLCHAAGLSFSIAHCNFGLRGAESDGDEAFVKSLAAQYKVSFFLQRFETKKFAEENKISIQEAARELRYHWFEQILNGNCSPNNSFAVSPNEQPPKYLLTAHHADDNMETVMMNFFKGTGISGMHGILPKSGKIIRPLLFAGRKEIEEYAKEMGLTWVEDSSNKETKYTRNFLRHKVVPLIEMLYPEVRKNMKASIERFREVEVLYQQSIALHKKKLIQEKGNEIYIPVLKLQRSSPVHSIVYEIIKDYNFNARQTEEVMKLLQSESGKYITSATHRILRNRAWLIISPLQVTGQRIILIEKKDDEIFFDNKTLLKKFIAPEKVLYSNNALVAHLDAKDITFPLLLRKWKPGDYFYPLGMRKKKKLSRFFIDQKLSLNDKEKVWVIESSKKIIWVVGLRIDDRFKITPATSKVLQLSITT